MRIADRSVYIGPSLYAHFPVIRLEVDLGALEAWPTARLGPAFTDALVQALPGLAEHGCSYGEPGGFLRRCREDEGTWLGHVLEHVVIELQQASGRQVTFGKTRSLDQPGWYQVVFQYEEETVGLEAANLGLTLLQSLLPPELRDPGAVPEGFDFTRARESFIRFAQRRDLGPSTASLVRVAQDRGIPWIRLNEYSLMQFGLRPLAAAHPGHRHQPHVAHRGGAGLGQGGDQPHPRHAGPAGAPAAAGAVGGRGGAGRARIGYPVVLKPYNGNHGRGVSIHLTDEEQVQAAFEVAKEQLARDRGVVHHRRRPSHAGGERAAGGGGQAGAGARGGRRRADHRATGGAGERRPAPRHRAREGAHAARVRPPGHTPAGQVGYGRATVPAAGEVVIPPLTGNLSTGGTAIDVTDLVHPDNVEMAVRAVKAIGLDVGGVDFLSPDITKSYKDNGAAICEVNAAPGFGCTWRPAKASRATWPARRDRHAVPGRGALAHSHRGRDGHQRQDHHGAHAGPHPQTRRALRRPHQHRRRVHRRAAHREGRHDRPRGDTHGAQRPARWRWRCSRLRVAACCAPAWGCAMSTSAPCSTCQSDHLGLKGIDTLEQLAAVKRIIGGGGAATPRCSTPTTRACCAWPTTPRPSQSAT
jgi:cyanophycin synthetase